MTGRPQTTARSDAAGSRYVFLSSPSREGNDGQDEPTKNVREQDHDQPATTTSFRPATTFHTTSISKVSETQRKTLGVRRSMQGWNARRKP
ncbi:hypothetical protein DOTSEDRAFT_119770 [Dothistroma septosporum NZE10]|uniref:Uncharacterized protein n=1 Tax=Dothistroma septosporum (strain NZE10 / CBS 128990) TaxID=675120 RepID=N1Q1R5_DOTSN|nr:hypothetical protein DOTSEDRAFT_119770 [Dothistroma septosporum NZE10]